MDRLTGESKSQNSNTQDQIAYGWDKVGNRLTKTNGNIGVSYTYSNGCNRMTGWTATSTTNFSDFRTVNITGYSTETIGTNQWLGQLYVSNSVSGASTTPAVSGSTFSTNGFLLAPGSNQIIAGQLLKYCHFMEDTQGHAMELRFIRDTDKREIDFAVLRDGHPEFAVECNTGEQSASQSCRYFRERTSIPRFYQVHLGERDFGNAESGTRVLPFVTFCRELALP